MRRLRFMVFNLLSWITLVIWATALLITAIFSRPRAYAIARNWSKVIAAMLGWFCGLTYRVEGRENIPDKPCVMFIKHSSAYETFIQLIEMPRSCWVLKRELVYVPFFGWALWALKAIAIDRSSGGKAVSQVIKLGTQRLAEGVSVAVFPEGTRMAPGQTKRYGISGTLLALESGSLILPVAHNAGYHWPRRSSSIKPGEIVFVIGKPVDPAGRNPRELNDEIQAWVEAQVARINSPTT